MSPTSASLRDDPAVEWRAQPPRSPAATWAAARLALCLLDPAVPMRKRASASSRFFSVAEPRFWSVRMRRCWATRRSPGLGLGHASRPPPPATAASRSALFKSGQELSPLRTRSPSSDPDMASMRPMILVPGETRAHGSMEPVACVDPRQALLRSANDGLQPSRRRRIHRETGASPSHRHSP